MDTDLIGDWQGQGGKMAFDVAGWTYALFDHDFMIDPTGNTLDLTFVGGSTTTFTRHYGNGPVLFGLWRYGPDANGEETDLAFLTPRKFYEVTSLDGIVDTLESGHFDTAGGSNGSVLMRKRRGLAQTGSQGAITIESALPGGVDQAGTYAFNADKTELTLTLNGVTQIFQRL